MKQIVLLTIIFINSTLLQSQHWQEQVVLEGEARAFCFDNNGDVLHSSKMSNGLYAICKYSYEKDTVSVIFKGTKTVEFLHVCTNGTILGFNDNYCYRSSDNGINWTAFEGDFDVDYLYPFSKSFMIEPNDSILILRSDGNQSYKSTDNGKTWSQIIIEGIDELFIFPINTDNLIAYTVREHFLYITSDSGFNWIKTEQDSNFTLRCIQKNPANDQVYALNNKWKLIKSNDFGYSWELYQPDPGFDTSYKDFIINKNNNVYLLDWGGNLFKADLNSNHIELISIIEPDGISNFLNFDFYKLRSGLYLNEEDELCFISQTISKFNKNKDSWDIMIQNLFKNDYKRILYQLLYNIRLSNEQVIFKNYENDELFYRITYEFVKLICVFIYISLFI